ncbi:MAG: hypothetical protein K0V04_01765 [Deltaproteobacteria bacterium]|nr:hypothetical protein [Deltaproteobacteria bacterium]
MRTTVGLVVAAVSVLCGCATDVPSQAGSASTSEAAPVGTTMMLAGSSGTSDPPSASSSGLVPGSCCASHPGAGCDELTIEACVCGVDAECCAFGWDDGCVQVAQTLCGSCGGRGTTGAGDSTSSSSSSSSGTGEPDPDCCIPSRSPGCANPEIEACVCHLDPFCCDAQWDELCVQAGVTSCETSCGPPASCCEFGLDPGCADPIVEACVCALDPSCCSTEWNGACVAMAGLDCGAGCKISGGAGDCCLDNGTPGCDDPVIQACVCVDDPFCCDVVWDYVCAAGAEGDPCFADCSGGSTGSTGDPPPSDCCAVAGSPGCSEPAVEACVCALEADCCTDHWGALCVDAAIIDCGLGC